MGRTSECSRTLHVVLRVRGRALNFGASANDVLALELAAAGTQFEADDKGKAAFETLMDGDQWMIYQNTKTATNHWDFVSGA